MSNRNQQDGARESGATPDVMWWAHGDERMPSRRRRDGFTYQTIAVDRAEAVAAACEAGLPAVLVIAAPQVRTRDVLRAVRAGPYGSAVPILVVAGATPTLDWIEGGASAIVGDGDAAVLRIYLESMVRTGRAIRRFYRGAATDALTGASSRRFFLEALAREVARAIRYGTPLSVAVIDVDGLKQINDTAGHPAGDAVLRSVAQVARTMIRASDEFGRLGGDEFGWILSGADETHAAAAAARFRDALAEAGTVCVSIGMATLTADLSPAALIAAADRNLYEHKARRSPAR